MLNFVDSVGEAVAGIKDGSTVMIGGFGNAGQPFELIDALMDCGATGLTVVNNNAGQGDQGLALLIKEGRVKKMICSFPRQSDSWHFDAKFRAGEIELELVPQGNLAERIRAAGAGIGGFFTPTGYGTMLAEGKETRILDGRGQVFETPIHADVALIKALTGRRQGQPRLPQDGPELRPDHGRRGQTHDRPGLRDRPHRRPRPGGHRDPRNLRQQHCEGGLR